MNKHFEDTAYYLKRAGNTAKKGVAEELEPVKERVEKLRGEEEPEPTRVEKVREELGEIQERATGETKEAIGNAREKLGDVQQKIRS